MAKKQTLISAGKEAVAGRENKKVSNTQSAAVAAAYDPVMIQIPQDFFIHSTWKSNALWFKLTARELIGQTTGGKATSRGGTLNIGRKGTTFKFLAPSQFIDTQSHTWEEYASIQSRLLQFAMSSQTSWSQIKEVYANLKHIFFEGKDGAFKMPSGMRIAEALGDVTVPKYKQDTPLKYTKSNRRTYQFTFTLADANGGEYMARAVQLLQKYAAPASKDIITIDFPYIFRVETIPYGVLTLEYAALESIMVTWMAPYIKGKPSRAELTLSFKDMSPLFRETIQTGGLVSVNQPPEVKQEEQNEVSRLQRAMEGFNRSTTQTAEDVAKQRVVQGLK